jgi:subfamily B ATP-binding cassette protein MsbA
MNDDKAVAGQGKVDPVYRHVWKRVVGFLRPYRTQFAIALGCMVVFGASEGGIPFLVKYLERKLAQSDASFLIMIPVVVIGFAVFRAVFDFAQQYLMSRIGHLVVRDLRNAVNDHLLQLSPGYFVRHSSADIISRMTSDVLLVKTLLTDSASSVIRDTIKIVFLIAAAVYLDPILAVIAFVAFPLGIYPVQKFGKKMRRLSKSGQDAIGSLSAMLQESIIGSKVVRIFLREDFEKSRFEKRNDELTETFIRSERVRAITGPINEVLASAAITGVILYGGYSVMGGTRSQGDFVAFLVAVFLLYDPFKKLSRVHNALQQGFSGAERLFEVLDHEPSVQEIEQPLALDNGNSIEFENVSFTYEAESQNEPALREIQLRVEEGARVALVGFSGSGKSTLVDLIPRFMDPQEGRVLIGGVDISQVSLLELRERIAMVDQHTFLFHDTIYNNIAYGKPSATRDEVEEAAKAAYAYDFIQQFPNGFETIVGESGMTLSGGERQRIAIARAILKETPILILDEATASLDNRSEREVQAALEALEEGKTSVVIAHRLSTVRNADRIVVLSDGRIVESGTHEELLSKGKEYSKLYALQFAAEDAGPEVDRAVVN